MPTVTISKELAKEKNLIAVPHKAYEEFVAWSRKVKSSKEFTPTIAEKKALLRARKNVAKGKFFTLAELRNAVGTKG